MTLSLDFRVESSVPLILAVCATQNDGSARRRGASDDSVSTLFVEPFQTTVHAYIQYYRSFADVHYYFQPPSSRPTVHRFDKGSYLYLYGNKSGSGARIEVANHAGTPEQDAFTGGERTFPTGLNLQLT